MTDVKEAETTHTEGRGCARGRRPDPAKDQAILEAARDLFLEKGYSVSVDDIAERAGVVKQTVYSRFKSKEELFAATIRAGAEELVAPLIADKPGRTVRATLTEFAEQYRRILLTPARVQIMRLLIAQADQFPDLARRFYEGGPLYTFDRLAAYLGSPICSEELEIEDAELAASQFLGLIKGVEHSGVLLGIADAETELQRRKRIDASVDAFMKLYGRN